MTSVYAPGAVRVIVAFISFAFAQASICEKPPVTPRDCVQVNYLKEFSLSPTASRVAYVVNHPDLVANTNVSQLYMQSLDGQQPGRLLVASTSEISQLQWLADGVRLLALVKEDGVISISSIDASSGVRHVIAKMPDNILRYSVAADGRTLVFETADSHVTGERPNAADVGASYEVKFEHPVQFFVPKSLIYVVHSVDGINWGAPTQLIVHDPYSHRVTSSFTSLSAISISPDGSYLSMVYTPDRLPKNWTAGGFYRSILAAAGTKVDWVNVVYAFKSGQTTVPYEGAAYNSVPFSWSPDGESYLIEGHAPALTEWDKDEIDTHRTMGGDKSLFWVHPSTGDVERVSGPSVLSDTTVGWESNEQVLVRTAGGIVTRFRRKQDGKWQASSSINIPLQDFYRYSRITGTFSSMVGEYQNVSTPPDLFVLNQATGTVRMLTHLNPQIDSLELAPYKKVEWSSSDGEKHGGFLLMPSDYVDGKRYPLVIQTKYNQGTFVCDSGPNHDPAFIPQPLADAGMMYLIASVPEGYKQADDIAHQPQQYPGKIGEVVQAMDMWQSAVKELDRQGLIDPSKVGIMGFSHTGWYVEYALAHSAVRFAAATAADNVQYSFGEYWLYHDSADLYDFENVYGGPPYGTTLKNWMEHSISFNMEHIHTPLMMELMGYGEHDDTPGKIPVTLASAYEVFTGLKRLQKPVVLYYYPDAVHQPKGPADRLGTLQRNFDWYRFWLQDYEDPNPAKKEQYMSWEHLREQRDVDLKTIAQPTASTTKTN